MKGRSFSNPLLMIRPFSTSRRHKNISGCEEEKAAGRGQDRKISIDQTVLSGDDSQLIALQDFSRSFDVDSGSVEISPPNFAHNTYNGGEENEDNAFSAKPSISEPPFFRHHHDSVLCDCSSPMSMAQGQELRYSTGSYPVSLPLNPQQPASPKSNDPALRARMEAIRIQQQLLGDNHPDVIFALSSLAKLHQKRGNHAEAASILRESQMRSVLAKSTPQPSSRKSPQEEQSTGVPTQISFSHQN